MSILNNILKTKLNKSSFILDDNEKYSYLDLQTDFTKFEKLKLSSGLIINICDNEFGFLSGYISFLNLRFSQLLIDNDISEKYLLNIIKIYKPKYIFAPKQKSIFLEKRIIFENKNYKLYELNYKLYPIHKNIALLISTSGSTGSKKFVKLSFNNILDNTKNICKYLKITKFDSTITTMSPAYSYGLSIINSHLFKNAKIVLTKKKIVEKKFWEIFKKNNITNFNGVPFLYEILLKLGLNVFNTKSLKFFTSAGGMIDNNKLEKIIEFCEKKNFLFFSMYGQTEASPRISYIEYPKNKKKLGSIGKPIPGGKLSIKKKELIYKGKNIFCGYSENNQDLSKIKNYKYLSTGDLGFKKKGFFYLTGRKKRIIKIFGYRISLDELENEILNSGHRCALKGADEKLIVIYEKKNSMKWILNYLIKQNKIPKGKIIFKNVKKIPMTSNNKINYNKL
tara:strand:+ start:1097 stop:2449 length:1353 start_codon:yes stop_codon:yes gene_type:complete